MRPSIALFRPCGVSDCERWTAACTIASKFLLRCSASRARVTSCSWFCFCSVMSLAIFDAPIILPSAFLTGETVIETAIKLPCFRCRIGLEMYSFSSSDVREDFAFFVLPVFWYHYRNGLTNRLVRSVAEDTLGTLPACNNAIEALAY